MTVSPLPELAPVLKQLRLSGLLESLDTRNREAIQSKLTYPEFLALVIQDEAERRDQKKYALRVRRAGFRGDKTIEGFDFDFNPVAVTLRRDLERGRVVGNGGRGNSQQDQKC